MADLFSNNNDLLGLNNNNNNNNNYNSYDNNYSNNNGGTDFNNIDNNATPYMSENEQNTLEPGSFEYAKALALEAMKNDFKPEEAAAMLIEEGYTEDQAVEVVSQLLNENNANNANEANNERINIAFELAREALLVNQQSIAEARAMLLGHGYTDEEANAVINKVCINANTGAQQFIQENAAYQQNPGMTGGIAVVCGIVLLVAGIFVSVFSENIIWTGGIGVGIYLIFKGIASR